jgi:hypothetical protein
VIPCKFDRLGQRRESDKSCFRPKDGVWAKGAR